MPTVAPDQLRYTMPSGTIIVWSESECQRVKSWLQENNLTGNFKVTSFDDITTRAK